MPLRSSRTYRHGVLKVLHLSLLVSLSIARYHNPTSRCGGQRAQGVAYHQDQSMFAFSIQCLCCAGFLRLTLTLLNAFECRLSDWAYGSEGDSCSATCQEQSKACVQSGMTAMSTPDEATFVASLLGVSVSGLTPVGEAYSDAPGVSSGTLQYNGAASTCGASYGGSARFCCCGSSCPLESTETSAPPPPPSIPPPPQPSPKCQDGQYIDQNSQCSNVRLALPHSHVMVYHPVSCG